MISDFDLKQRQTANKITIYRKKKYRKTEIKRYKIHANKSKQINENGTFDRVYRQKPYFPCVET